MALSGIKDTKLIGELAERLVYIEHNVKKLSEKNIEINIDSSIIDLTQSIQTLKNNLANSSDQIDNLANQISDVADALDKADKASNDEIDKIYGGSFSMSDIDGLTYYSTAWGTGGSGTVGKNVSSDGNYTVNRFEITDNNGNHLAYILVQEKILMRCKKKLMKQ